MISKNPLSPTAHTGSLTPTEATMKNKILNTLRDIRVSEAIFIVAIAVFSAFGVVFLYNLFLFDCLK